MNDEKSLFIVPSSSFILLFRRARFRPLGAILRTALLPIGNTDRVQRSANHVIPDTRQVLHAPAADQHNRVLLQIVSDTRDVGRDLDAVCQTNASHLAQRRIRFLRSLCVDARANPALLRRTLERRAGRLVFNLLTTFANKLIYCRQCSLPSSWVAPSEKAQGGVTCLFPELVRKSAQATARLRNFN
jgi:hypothetical protein